jgi:hypothetical protein
MSTAESQPRASIVIPAHNEQQVIGRLLHALLHDALPGEFDIIVVCNGCTDSTADVAKSFGWDIRVLQTPAPSKGAALRLGDDHARTFPRVYVDADIVVTAQSMRALIEATSSSGALAAAPRREVPMDDVSWGVRAYYRVWLALPYVEDGLFGRGIVAVSATGHARVHELPALMSDDLAISQAFARSERIIVRQAQAIVRPPRTMAALLKRKKRSIIGNTQLEREGLTRMDARTSMHDLMALARRSPRSIPDIVLFLGVAVAGRISSRRQLRQGDFVTWHRDETSRSAR